MTLDSEPTPKDEPPQDAQADAQRQTDAPNQQISFATTKLDVPPPESQCSRSKHKQKHWIDYLTAFLELVGLAVLCVYAAYTIKIYCANKEAADAATLAANTAAESLRPWVKIDDVELRKDAGPIQTLMFHFPPNPQRVVPPTLQIRISTRNIGHSVASNVEAFSELFLAKFENTTWHDLVANEEKRFCQASAEQDTHSPRMIFPDDPATFYMGTSGGLPSNVEGGTHTAASLIVCVKYRGVSKSEFATWAQYGLYEDGFIYIPIGKDASFEELKLEHEETGDQAY